MAWSWSHTNEAYSNAYENVHDKPHDWLVEVMAEWNAKNQLDAGKTRRYPKSVAWAQTLASDTLADAIWDKMQEQSTCDNGGFNAWACPFGCHTVSFDCEAIDA